MSEKINHGGPAFPSDHKMAVVTHGGKLETFGHDGMSLRQFYAAHALQGLLAKFGPEDDKIAAQICLKYADALIKEEKDGG